MLLTISRRPKPDREVLVDGQPFETIVPGGIQAVGCVAGLFTLSGKKERGRKSQVMRVHVSEGCICCGEVSVTKCPKARNST